MAEQYTERPTEIEVFPLGSETDVILRKSIAESETTGENGDVATCWQCEERQIRVPGTVSAEDIAADFEAWWEYTPGTKAQSVEDVRTETVAQMSATCNAAIVGGVDVTLTGGETKHFSLTLEDQLNLLSLQGRVASGADSVPYHADGEECSYYSAADFGRIADAATRWKLYQESYFNALRGYILALETVTELRGVTYGMDIPEAYRTDVLRALLAQQETADVADAHFGRRPFSFAWRPERVAAVGNAVLGAMPAWCGNGHGCRVRRRVRAQPLAWAGRVGLHRYAVQPDGADLPAVFHRVDRRVRCRHLAG